MKSPRLFFAFSFLFALQVVSAEERVVAAFTVEPGQERKVAVDDGEARLLGWRVALEQVKKAEDAASCEEAVCGVLSAKKLGLAIPGRFGALKKVGKGVKEDGAVSLAQVGPLTFRNNSKFTYSVEILAHD